MLFDRRVDDFDDLEDLDLVDLDLVDLVLEDLDDFNDYCEECKKQHKTVSQNLILTGFKVCESCRISKTIFPI